MIGKSSLKGNYIRYRPQTLLSAIRVNEKLYIDLPGKDSVTSVKNSYL